ncbi:MAG TPA: pantetheine-phosphate adenylyltransferase [Patescibacteria group bacterium]|nr:pantetheine-phosphate adenylyltransferase [Patescibacteria group bacterium]
MRIAVCPGSFDPVTNGHVDIFARAATMFDLLIVAVFHNPGKKPLFTMEERVEMLNLATKDIPNIRVDSFSGLLNDYVHRQNSQIIVRGLRAFSDFEYEFQRALLIKKIDPLMETVFMMTNSEYSFVSSSGIKELAKFGGDISKLVPECVQKRVVEKMAVEE